MEWNTSIIYLYFYYNRQSRLLIVYICLCTLLHHIYVITYINIRIINLLTTAAVIYISINVLAFIYIFTVFLSVFILPFLLQNLCMGDLFRINRSRILYFWLFLVSFATRGTKSSRSFVAMAADTIFLFMTS